MVRCMKVAVVQMCVGTNKCENLEKAAKHIKKAKSKGAALVILPESFNSIYGPKHFVNNAERLIGGDTPGMLQREAKKNSIYVIGGTFPEEACSHMFNLCSVWGPNGELIAKLRKLHLFDVNIPGKLQFKESALMKKGDVIVTCKILGFKIGLGIGYDLRFEEFAKMYRFQGCHMLVYPAAFHKYTGGLHYDILQRARAVDNQVYVCSATQARAEDEKEWHNWGHSQITDPWGRAIAKTKDEEEIIYATIDKDTLEEARCAIPIFHQRRTDIYDAKKKKL